MYKFGVLWICTNVICVFRWWKESFWFLVNLVTNIIEDTDGDQCPLLDAKPEYLKRIYNGRYANQFEVLKDETYAGIKNTATKTFPNGYEKLLAVRLFLRKLILGVIAPLG